MTYAETPIPLSTHRQSRQTERKSARSEHLQLPDVLSLSSLSTCRQGVACPTAFNIECSRKKIQKPAGAKRKLSGRFPVLGLATSYPPFPWSTKTRP